MSVVGPTKVDQRFYGYKHWTLEATPRCFNVGKGLKARSHQKNSRNHKWRAIVKRYGLRVEICVGPTDHFTACAWEIENIALMNTFSTNHSHDDDADIGCNLTHGGEGGFGRVVSVEERLKHSHDAKAQWADPEKRAALVAKFKAAWRDPLVFEKHLVASRIVANDPAIKAKQLASLSSPEVEAKHSASAKAYWRDHPEELAKRTESQRRSWAKRRKLKKQ